MDKGQESYPAILPYYGTIIPYSGLHEKKGYHMIFIPT
jgi:hypothetical protein